MMYCAVTPLCSMTYDLLQSLFDAVTAALPQLPIAALALAPLLPCLHPAPILPTALVASILTMVNAQTVNAWHALAALPASLIAACLAACIADALAAVAWALIPPPCPCPRPPSPLAAPLPSQSSWSWSVGDRHEAHDPVMACMRASWLIMFGVLVLLALHPLATMSLCMAELVLHQRLGPSGRRQAGALAAAAAGMAPLTVLYAPSAVAWAHANLSYTGGCWMDVPLVVGPWVVAHAALTVLDVVMDVSLKTLARGRLREAAHRVARASAAVGRWTVMGVPVCTLVQALVAGGALALRGRVWLLYAVVACTCLRVWVAAMVAGLHAKSRLLASLEAHMD